MEQKFLQALETARLQAEALGVRIRPMDMEKAKRCLSSHKESDGFWALADKNRLELSLEAISLKKQFTALFTDEQANNALNRLLDAGYTFMN